MEVGKELLETALVSSMAPILPGTPKWRKPENQENPTIQQLRYLFYTSMFVAIQLHDLLLEYRRQKITVVGNKNMSMTSEVFFLQQHIDLITPTIWFNITPGLRLIYLLVPRVLAYYF